MPVKKNKRPTTARFTTEECELLLEAVTKKMSHDQADWDYDSDGDLIDMWYRIKDRLKARIDKANQQSNQQSD